MQGDWITAIASIVAAIIAVILTYIFEGFRRGRSSLRFVVHNAQDLTRALRSHGKSFEVKFNDAAIQQLILRTITVQNAGNTIIEDVRFEIVIDGRHQLALAEAASKNLQLRSDITIESDDGPFQIDPIFKISMPYLNAKESFEIKLFHDGKIEQCFVHCRLPGVTTAVLTGDDLDRRRYRKATLTIYAGIFLVFIGAGLVLYQVISMLEAQR